MMRSGPLYICPGEQLGDPSYPSDVMLPWETVCSAACEQLSWMGGSIVLQPLQRALHIAVHVLDSVAWQHLYYLLPVEGQSRNVGLAQEFIPTDPERPI